MSKAEPKKNGAFATLAPLTAAAVSTAALMYPVDVLRGMYDDVMIYLVLSL